MKIIDQSSDRFSSETGTCITVGTFDGIHRGHNAILSFLRNTAANKHLNSLIFTFDKHPRYVLRKDENLLKLLNTSEEKARILEEKGIDYLYIQEFNEAFYSMEAEDFIKDILISTLNMKALVVGHDHSFGKGRMGDFSLLKELSQKYGFSVHQLSAVSNSGFAISSTKIRTLLAQGDLTLANEMLGYNYSLTGTVIHGRGVGKDLGFPTANIKASNPDKLLPAPGVYIIEVEINQEMLQGILNIGSRPTFNGEGQHVEAHIFDFSGDLYTKEVRIEFLLRIRDEMKFYSLEALIEQIEKDKYKALHYFKRVC
ncbi:MAG: riboflavin biosynthesis protein RibF [Marinilabiliales bacterium]|nr:MAG: riboflavin biosynthesis protein RibF [Marinilabiliales bacterium]